MLSNVLTVEIYLILPFNCCLMTNHKKRKDTCTAYHEYFIFMFDTVHGDRQRCKLVGDTVKENRLIVWFWLLV